MKALFGSLLCLVLVTSQAYAVKGGPQYPGGANLVGSYAGVLQGFFDPTNPSSSNSIGIFTLGIPQSGNATGAFLMFARGRTFRGTIDAFADTNKSSLKGILSATFNYTLQTLNEEGALVSVPVTASARGPVNARAVTGKASVFSTGSTLLRGDATLNISQGGVTTSGDPFINEILLLSVNGLKQSNTAPTTSGTSSTGSG